MYWNGLASPDYVYCAWERTQDEDMEPEKGKEFLVARGKCWEFTEVMLLCTPQLRWSPMQPAGWCLHRKPFRRGAQPRTGRKGDFRKPFWFPAWCTIAVEQTVSKRTVSNTAHIHPVPCQEHLGSPSRKPKIAQTGLGSGTDMQ